MLFQCTLKPDSFERDRKAAGIPKRPHAGGPSFSTHSLRHFGRVWMESRSAFALGEIQMQMGHRTRAMTEKVYGDRENEMLGRKMYESEPLLPPEFRGSPGRPTKKSGKKTLDKRSSGRQTDAATDVEHGEPPAQSKRGSLGVNPSRPSLFCEPLVRGPASALCDGEQSGVPPPGVGTQIGVGHSNPPTPIGDEKCPDLIGAYSRVVEALAEAERTIARLLRKE